MGVGGGLRSGGVSPSSGHQLSCRSTLPNIFGLRRNGSCTVYEVGYTIVELIVTRWDDQALRDLIAANNSVQSVFGLTPAQFQEAWEQLLENRYL